MSFGKFYRINGKRITLDWIQTPRDDYVSKYEESEFLNQKIEIDVEKTLTTIETTVKRQVYRNVAPKIANDITDAVQDFAWRRE
ncbi:MAG: hypothetical protein KJ697_04525 [Nanoarchaeota archaeon]|nr:hypothetical protein [Nanoarchaeota archaeon]MBU4123986.1 hypothetical protein [Nanoarchaeota archaeon]